MGRPIDRPDPRRQSSRRLCLRAIGAGLILAGAGEAARGQATPLRGAGATFPQPVVERWADQYRRATDVDIRYEGVGSVEGVRLVSQGLVDFAVCDAPLPATDLRRLGLLQFPLVVGALVPVFNLRGVPPGSLRLTGEVLADIYLGGVRHWNDPALRALNPGIDLPSEFITVVHRADASGSSWMFTDYLSRHSAAWCDVIGTAAQPRWPLGDAATGNDGVASLVQRTRASLGYVEYAYALARRLSAASLLNPSQQVIVPGLAAFRAAVDAASWPSGDAAPSLLDIDGDGAWPLTNASHVLMSLRPDSDTRVPAMLAFFGWAFNQGNALAEGLGYVPVPALVQQQIQQQWPRNRSAAVAQAQLRGRAG